MFKAIRKLGSSLRNGLEHPLNFNKQANSYFSNWVNFSPKSLVQCAATYQSTMLQNSVPRTFLQANSNNLCLSRNVTKFSLKTGKKKSVNSIFARFYRLHCGIWIHRRAGAHKRLWRKNCHVKYPLVQHVACTKTQSYILDTMTTDFPKKRKYYIDDPFEPYHDRHNLDWVPPRRKR